MVEITLEWLKKQNACSRQIDDFEEEWGEGVTLTQSVNDRALDLHMDLNWLATDTNLLTNEEMHEYCRGEGLAWEIQEATERDIMDRHFNAKSLSGVDTVAETKVKWAIYDKTLAEKLLTILLEREKGHSNAG